MGEFSVWHLLILLAIILYFFRPRLFSKIGRAFQKAFRTFKQDLEDKPPRLEREAKPIIRVEKDKNKK